MQPTRNEAAGGPGSESGVEECTGTDDERAFLHRGMTLAMEWAVQGLVIPHVGRTIDSTVEAINMRDCSR